MENNLDPKSTLNPLTNSLSLSEKSKGERLVSAKIEMNQNKKTKGKKINIEILKLKYKIEKDP